MVVNQFVSSPCTDTREESHFRFNDLPAEPMICIQCVALVDGTSIKIRQQQRKGLECHREPPSEGELMRNKPLKLTVFTAAIMRVNRQTYQESAAN
ncbi:hypothetical protein BAUCODRAFT_465867 [Baudoinia panamericana UAMH 10762]|uniref:Uncharacterized protein n=1 Tax=Baudoinia panamericana (strain UAMH 10762) TaxID=717646 RepID=M2NBC1_BAUPA|nr:uncharacterized protein BAUCODRAFT_465867 [Baudoinia panamericana UAMH 10762]EMC96180.1 hypothetical protein BAUCODRAFT_465867 [Baudoinia panamericana UAMH 10762]